VTSWRRARAAGSRPPPRGAIALAETLGAKFTRLNLEAAAHLADLASHSPYAKRQLENDGRASGNSPKTRELPRPCTC